MSDFERHAAEREARRAAPGRGGNPREENRRDMLRRYLGAVASAAESRAGEPPAAPPPAGVPPPPPEPPAHAPAPPLVRDVMTAPAVSVPGDMPYLEVARTLSRERLSAVPVVDPDSRVVGMVSESDLLAKAAVIAAERRPGPIGRLREHHLYEKSRGETASALMTYPAVTVHPEAQVADAAWIAARSRLKRLPVTDHRGRLVGVVSRIDLLRALVRSDAEIREEAESRVRELLPESGAVRVAVENGVVALSGEADVAAIPELLEAVREIEDVVDVADRLRGV